MNVETFKYNSSIEAFSALVRSLLIYEQRYNMSSEDFYAQYQSGKLDDSADFVEWAGDYQHYLSLKSEIERRLKETRKSQLPIP